jgi:hypothetical protein
MGTSSGKSAAGFLRSTRSLQLRGLWHLRMAGVEANQKFKALKAFSVCVGWEGARQGSPQLRLPPKNRTILGLKDGRRKQGCPVPGSP